MARRIRSKAALVVIVYVALFLFLFIALRSDRSVGRLYDAERGSCLAVTEDLKIIRPDAEDCKLFEAQWSGATDGSLGPWVYEAADGPLCLTNTGDMKVELKECTGEPNQQWRSGADNRLISTYTEKAKDLATPEEEEYCLTSQMPLLNGGRSVGLRPCAKRPTKAQRWPFESDDSVFSF